MDKSAIMQRLASILQQTYGVDTSDVTPETTLSQIGIDSMISADLMMELEEELGFRFETMDMPRNATVQDVAGLVERNLSANAPPDSSPRS